jgi:histidinol-phosphate aminotransferase
MTSPAKIVRDDVRAMSAYHVPCAVGMVKLDAMENPYALPAPLRREIAELTEMAQINRYPDPLAPALKKRLREVMGISEKFDILLGNGSDEIIQIIIQSCAKPGACIMAPGPTFAMYRQYALIAGLKYESVPLEADFSMNVDAFCRAMEASQPAIVFISYPNNPTGNLFDQNNLKKIIATAPGLVVMDEAYQPFAEQTFLGALDDFPNLVLLRTVSKLGLAGLRLGYAVGLPDWMREFDKVRSPYNVNVLTQLVAEKVLAHHDVLDGQARAIRAERAKLVAALACMPGAVPFPSQANFVLARVPDAFKVCEELRQRKILVKCMHGMHPLLEGCLRITIGTDEENAMLISELRAVLERIEHGV